MLALSGAVVCSKKTENYLRSKNRRRVRCSAVFVVERFILSRSGAASAMQYARSILKVTVWCPGY
ncbi:hypothetical protein HMPREF0880_01761 [Yokenella regensburgei ATCC 43003]|nr:hypothetical protein HMPREF0880_01761 [Yokenella regensburgei ATCC 43003]